VGKSINVIRIDGFGCFILTAIILLSICSEAQSRIQQKETMREQKILIVYLTRTKNTKAIAEIIHQKTGGDMVELELRNPYPENYQAIVAQVNRENETNFLPELKTRVDSIEKYDIVFLGAPTWDMQLPPPMKSFLTKYDLSGKTVVPFNTNAGYGVGTSFDTIKKLCPNSTVLKGFSIEGGIERDGILFVMEGEKKVKAEKEVIKWLNEIKLIK
jgi:flavodoxin